MSDCQYRRSVKKNNNVWTHHFQTFTISSSEPVTMVSDPSASLLPHAAVQMASSCAEDANAGLINVNSVSTSGVS